VTAVATRHRSRLPALAFVAAAALPWSVQVFSGRDATFLFAWGLVNTDPVTLTTLPAFLFVYTQGLPEYIVAWPLSVALYLLAGAVALVGRRLGRADHRVPAGLLAVGAVLQVQLAWGFSVQPNRVAWPVGAVVLLAVAALQYQYADSGTADGSDTG
jgi:uncharacterized protein (TIGR04206 family)